MSQTERLYWIDGQIRAGRCPDASAVSERFEVSRRTAYADRDYLIHRLHAPLAFDRRRGGWVYHDPGYVLPFLALSEHEAATLRRSLMAAREYVGQSEEATIARLVAYLQPYVGHTGETASETVGGAVRPWRDIGASADLLDDCRRAIAGRHRLNLLYYSAHRDVLGERTVQPYHLHHWRGEPYLIAWCEWRAAFRDFFLGRIREWGVLAPEGAFRRDPGFDVASYLAGGFPLMHGEDVVTVRARFSPYQARWIRERRYHASQETEEEPDGGLVLTLRVAGTAEAGRWLRTFGSEVEVLEPLALRRELSAEAKKLERIYGAPRE